jgi:hypothetical protein
MSKNKLSSRLLKEYVKEVLTEDSFGASTLSDAGITAGDISAAAGPYGMAFGSSEDLKNTFITPFTDVFKTAVGKTKEITRKTRTLLTVSFGVILTTLIPGLGAKYSEVFEKEKKDIQKIRNEYKDVYERTNKALASTDAAFIAFMTAPELTISALALSKSPEVIKGTLSVLTGGFSDTLFKKVMDANFEEFVDKKFSEKNKKKNESVAHSPVKQLLKEVSEEEASRKILSNKKFLKKSLAGASNLREIQKIATETYRRSLSEVYKQAVSVLREAKTIEDLEKLTGKKIPEAEELKQLPQQEREPAEKMLIDATRKTMKEFYVKNLQSQIDTVVKAGVPEESPYVQDFMNAIQKIRSL